MKFNAILFDFDGVLIESEAVGGREIAETLTALGHPTRYEDAISQFNGLADTAFLTAVEGWIGGPIPPAFHTMRAEQAARGASERIEEVVGAVAFVRALPPELPVAVVSSSSVEWIARHLGGIGLRDRFGPHLYSGRTHVQRGKPAPDLYLFGAAALGVPIKRCVVLEDSVVGATGAVASGATVIGLCAGTHCLSDHDQRLRAAGVHHVAGSFDAVATLVGLPSVG